MSTTSLPACFLGPLTALAARLALGSLAIGVAACDYDWTVAPANASTCAQATNCNCSAGTCAATCPRGSCELVCGAGDRCAYDCSGRDCDFVGLPGSTLTTTCSGGAA